MTSSTVPFIGATLGRYRIEERLGQGGMATVYRAADPTLGRDVAIKVMHPFIAERVEASRRFEREARALAGLRHPNVLALHDYLPADGETPAYLVMELLSGPSLRRFLDEHGAPHAEVGAMVGLRVAQALAAAHARAIVHRDVKPENVMLDGARVVLCDFGIARMGLDGGSGVTATGALVGSPAYMSPEQAAGDDVDARSDLFSLGSLLYQLATGALPFAAPTPLTMLARIAAGRHAPPSAKNARVPRWLERVIERCLQVDAAARFESAAACAAALERGLGDDGLGDVERELAQYLRDPPAYNQALGKRIVDGALAQARAAATARRTAQALAAASRVLAWEPENAEALALIRRFERRRFPALAFAGALLLAAGATWMTTRTHIETTKTISITKTTTTTAPTAMAVAPRTETPTVSETKTSPETPKPRSRSRSGSRTEVAAEAAPEPPAPPPLVAAAVATSAELRVEIAPWCQLTVDGTPRGPTPQRLTLPAGPHHLDCQNPSSGARLARDVTLAPGAHELVRARLYAAARVTPSLTRGDAFSIDGDAAGGAARDVEPGRRRVTLLSGGRAVDTAYVEVAPGGCRLVDAPQLACEKP